jgi:hypothetical protein
MFSVDISDINLSFNLFDSTNTLNSCSEHHLDTNLILVKFLFGKLVSALEFYKYLGYFIKNKT